MSKQNSRAGKATRRVKRETTRTATLAADAWWRMQKDEYGCDCPFCKVEPIHEIWRNNIYHAEVHFQARSLDKPVEYMKIWRNDLEPTRTWKDLQRIKNDIIGPNTEACELFPDEDRLIDTENCYWLWCLPPGERYDFGVPAPRMIGQNGIAQREPRST